MKNGTRVVTVCDAAEFRFAPTESIVPRGTKGFVHYGLLGEPREVIVRWDGGSWESRVKVKDLRELSVIELLAELA